MIAAALAIVAQLTITVSAPDTVMVSAPITISIHVTGPGAETPRVIAPSFRPFNGVRTSMTSRTVSYPPWTTVELQYVLSTPQAGTFTLEPFEARLGAQRARSGVTRIVVRPAPELGAPAIVARARLDSSARVNFHAIVVPETVYVGQQATYQVAVFLDDDVRLRLRRNPEFIPPEMRSMLSYDLALGRTLLQERRVGDRRYEVHVFQRAIFPLSPGRHVIPEARLVYSLPLSSSFFSREETHTLRAETVQVVALEPPALGRPDDFAGAVGDYHVDARLDAASGRVGDPLVLTLRVSGNGNVKLLSRPTLAIPWASAVSADERVSVDSGSLIVRGVKEFDWVLTPRQAGRHELPPIRYPYFAPDLRAYRVAQTAPETLTIGPGTLAAADSSALPDSARVLPLRPRLRAAPSPPLFTRPWFLGLLLLAPVPALALGVANRPRRARRAPPAAAALRALARGASKSVDTATLRRAFIRALSERLYLSPATVTTDGALSRALRRAGVTPPLAADAERFLARLDDAAYGSRADVGAEDARRADTLYRAIDREARTRATLGVHRSAVLLLAVALSSATVTGWAATLAPDAERIFAQGTAAYESRRFADAQRLFGEVTQLEPRAPDAWANFGTASWAVRDTAGAVLGWQRALRLEPLASDVRENLSVVASADAGISAVPAVPPGVPALVGALLWIAAWSLAALRARRRDIVSSRWPPVIGAAAVACALVTFEVDRQVTGRGLVVVTESTAVRESPALAAESSVTLGPGDIVRGVRRQSTWTRVRLPGGREGWIETDRLVELSGDESRRVIRDE